MLRPLPGGTGRGGPAPPWPLDPWGLGGPVFGPRRGKSSSSSCALAAGRCLPGGLRAKCATPQRSGASWPSSLPTAFGPWSCRVRSVFARRPHYGQWVAPAVCRPVKGTRAPCLGPRRPRGSVPRPLARPLGFPVGLGCCAPVDHRRPPARRQRQTASQLASQSASQPASQPASQRRTSRQPADKRARQTGWLAGWLAHPSQAAS